MPKRVTVNKKLIDKLSLIVSIRMDLSNTEELSEYAGYELFNQPPEFWNDFEKSISEYQSRVSMEIIGDIKKLLGYADIQNE